VCSVCLLKTPSNLPSQDTILTQLDENIYGPSFELWSLNYPKLAKLALSLSYSVYLPTWVLTHFPDIQIQQLSLTMFLNF